MNLIYLFVLGIICAIIAFNKGYNPYIWFFASGAGLLLMIVLPSANAVLKDEKLIIRRKKLVNIAGIFFGAIVVFLLISYIIIFWDSKDELEKLWKFE